MREAKKEAVLDSGAEVLDGMHHAWCQGCRPDWVARPLGAELGVPFTAWCGKRAVILTVWQSDDTPPGALCPVCWATPPPPCATCGKHLTPPVTKGGDLDA